MYIKLHKSYRTIVALCDKELIGKKFEEGNRQLDARENFYKDKEVTHEQATKILQEQSLEDATFNIVGEKSVKAALEAKIISEKNIGKVDNIPFALVLI
tara:strand:- start:741 stop:1037 length:297 start_codon:yes stop_codon:yes gene_type:complete